MPSKRMLLIPVLAAATLLLGGCQSLIRWRDNGWKVGPNYQQPVAPVAATWTDANQAGVTVNGRHRPDWWRVFNDPVLDQLVVTAYQRNLSLRSAAFRVLQARRQRSIEAANLLPQSQAYSATFARSQVSRTTANAFPGAPRAFDDWATGFDLSWELDVWGRIRRGIEAADATIDGEIELYDDALVTLIGDVVSTYIEIRAFDERLQLAAANVKAQEGSLKIARERKAAGRVSDLDVQQAISNLADTRASIPSLKQGRRQAVNRLAILLGMPPSSLHPFFTANIGRVPAIPSEVVVGIPAELLRRRPDVRAAERAIAVRSAQIGIAEAELYPQMSLSGEIVLNSQNFSSLFSSASNAGFIAPQLRWKILNYGRLVNNVKIQELGFQQAIVDYESTVLKAHQEVEDGIVGFLRSRERATELQTSVTASLKAVDKGLLQYKEGATDFNNVFVLQSNLVQRQDQLVATRAEIALALAQVYKALGGGWQLRYSIPYDGNGAIPVSTQNGIPQQVQPQNGGGPALGQPDSKWQSRRKKNNGGNP